MTRVSFPSDSSAALISHLSRDATENTVVLILAWLGFTITKDCVQFSRSADNYDKHRSAIVTVEDPTFANRLCDALAKRKHFDVTAALINVPAPDTYRLSLQKVVCLWEKPTQVATLWFGCEDEDMADAVCLGFSCGHYKILGQPVPCIKRPRRSSKRRWVLTLRDVPARAGTADVTTDIPVHLLPLQTRLNTNILTMHLSQANQAVETLLLGVGSMSEWLESQRDVPGDHFTAVGHFRSDATAREAVVKLNNRDSPFISYGKLTVKLLYSVALTVETHIYEAAKQDISDLWPSLNGRHPELSGYADPSFQGLTDIRIEGPVPEIVIAARKSLEGILHGEIVMKDGKAIWTPFFAMRGRVYQELKKIERDHGIFIIVDQRRSQLRLLGPRQQLAEAREPLIQLSQANLPSVYYIQLNDQQFSRALNGGYRAITAAIGNGIVQLDIASSPKRIVLAGSEADLALAQQILAGKRTAPTSAVGSVGDCIICWAEPEAPVLTSCNHIYCAGCLEAFCFGSINAADPRIRCQGDGGKCGSILPMAELKVHLTPAVLEDILEAAFAAHVARHSSELQYCPTPDCEHLYRPTNQPGNDDESSPLVACPNCLADLCTSCKVVSHDGMTCAEQRDHATGGWGALARAKEELGIRDCPKCGTGIEKISGCNHIMCLACMTHMCWVCMETFPARGPVYEHMNIVHGGIGIPYYPHLV